MNEYKKRQVREWRIPILFALALFLLLQFVLFIGIVPTDSMEPTIKAGSVIVGNRRFHSLEKNDVIVFRMEGRCIVKRIAGVPGDTIELHTKRMKVPQNSYYVLGDNPKTSYDSRYYAEPFIHEDDVIAVIW